MTTSPFTIAIDIHEKKGWDFKEIPSRNGRLNIPTVRQSLGIGMGDYTIAEAVGPAGELRMSIERKSVSDLFQTVIRGRKRFVRELDMLNSLDYAAVVVEGTLADVFTHKQHHWKKLGLTDEEMNRQRRRVCRSIIAWQLRYPIVRWWFLPTQITAMTWAYHLMAQWWKENACAVS